MNNHDDCNEQMAARSHVTGIVDKPNTRINRNKIEKNRKKSKKSLALASAISKFISSVRLEVFIRMRSKLPYSLRVVYCLRNERPDLLIRYKRPHVYHVETYYKLEERLRGTRCGAGRYVRIDLRFFKEIFRGFTLSLAMHAQMKCYTLQNIFGIMYLKY